MRIRRADPTDLDTVVEFNAKLAEESEGLALDRDRLRAGVEAVLADRSKGFYLVAESDGRAVGQLALTFEWSDWRNGMFWWLQSVYVRPECRRQGVLRALYGRVLQLAAENGVCGVRLYGEQENGSAKAAYRQLGLSQAVFQMYEVDFVIDRKHGE